MVVLVLLSMRQDFRNLYIREQLSIDRVRVLVAAPCNAAGVCGASAGLLVEDGL